MCGHMALLPRVLHASSCVLLPWRGRSWSRLCYDASGGALTPLVVGMPSGCGFPGPPSTPLFTRLCLIKVLRLPHRDSGRAEIYGRLLRFLPAPATIPARPNLSISSPPPLAISVVWSPGAPVVGVLSVTCWGRYPVHTPSHNRRDADVLHRWRGNRGTARLIWVEQGIRVRRFLAKSNVRGCIVGLSPGMSGPLLIIAPQKVSLMRSPLVARSVVLLVCLLPCSVSVTPPPIQE